MLPTSRATTAPPRPSKAQLTKPLPVVGSCNIIFPFEHSKFFLAPAGRLLALTFAVFALAFRLATNFARLLGFFFRFRFLAGSQTVAPDGFLHHGNLAFFIVVISPLAVFIA